MDGSVGDGYNSRVHVTFFGFTFLSLAPKNFINIEAAPEVSSIPGSVPPGSFPQQKLFKKYTEAEAGSFSQASIFQGLWAVKLGMRDHSQNSSHQ